MELIKKFVKSNWFIFIILSVLAGFGFWTVLHGEFLYDDRVLIVENTYLRSFSNIPTFFVSNAARGSNILDTNLYRPLINIIHTILFSLVGLETFVYHMFNVVLHVVNAFLIYVFLRKMSFSKIGSVLAAAIFVIHPIQAESVGYVSGIPDILCTTFILLGFNLFLNIGEDDEKVERRSTVLMVIALLLFLSFLTKELAVVFAPLILSLAIYKWPTYNGMTKQYVKKLVYLVFGMTGLYLVLKFTLLNFTGGSLSLSMNNDLYNQSMWIRIITFSHMILEYFRLLFWPIDLFFEKPVTAYTFFGLQGAIGMLVILGGALFAFISYFRERLFMIAYLMFFIGLSPVSGILIPANFRYTDHWLYIPIIGFLILIAALYDKFRGQVVKGVFVGISIVVIVLFGYRLSLRNSEWADPIAFFENEITYYPTARVYNLLGFEYMQTLQMKKAIEYFNKAIELDDAYPHPHFHLGSLYYGGGNITKALDEFYAGLKSNPNHIATLSSIGIIADSLGELEISDDMQLILANIQKGKLVKFEDLPPRSAFPR